MTAARRLIGCLLVHGPVAGIIVETEAYTGADDPGSHACRGPRQRNLPMFGPPGRAYVYKCHMYPLLNVVTEPSGKPGAVLLRALSPVAGLPLMRRRSPGLADDDLCRGPGRLARSMGVRLGHNISDLLRGSLFLARPTALRPTGLRRHVGDASGIAKPTDRRRHRITVSTRIGLRGPAARLRRRFFAADSQCVSK
jgi:DNA-3-methyladenine glycosylase